MDRTNTPDFSRLAAAVSRREPDRVPLADAAISCEIMGEWIGRPVAADDVGAQVEFWQSAGYDYVALTAGMMQPGKVTLDSRISRVILENVSGPAVSQGEPEWNLEKKSFIGNEADFEAFPWEEAARLDFSKFRRARPLLPPGMRIVALSGKIFTLSWMLMGYENFCVKLKLEPGLVKNVVDAVARIQYAALREAIAMPEVGALWAVDDLAFGTGPIIDPRDLRALIFPWYRIFAEECRAKGKLFFFHSDGLLWDLMEDLIGLGVDALHPVDPTCMDIDEVKRRVGDRICLFGNISNELLMTGTPDEVADLTRRRIRSLAPGGGYCVGSGNSVPEWAKIENYRAMVETVMEYGIYPIR